MKFPLINPKVYYLIIVVLGILIVYSSTVNATVQTLPPVTQNTCVNLPQSEYNSTYQYISYIQGPAPRKYMYNISSNMTNLGNYYYIYNFCNTSEVGSYIVNGISNLGNWNYDFPVNPISIPEAILYIALIFFLLGLLSAFSYQVVKSDTTNGWRIGMFNLSYFVFIGLMFFIWKVSNDFLPSISYLTSVIYYLWFIPLMLSWIMILVSIALLINSALQIGKAKKLIRMGYSESEAESRVRRKK